MKSIIVQILRVNICRTIIANFFYLKWNDAVRFPIVVCRGAKFKAAWGGVIFNCPVKFGLLRIGSRSARNVDSRYERTIFINEGHVYVNGYTWVGVGCRVNVYSGAELLLGKDLKITGRTTIICRKRIIVGDDCLFSWDIQIMDTDFHKIYDNDGRLINADKEILIGDHVWIGARSTILKGSKIPSRCVVAAGCLFSGRKDVNNCIYAGQGKEIRVIKDNINWSDM